MTTEKGSNKKQNKLSNIELAAYIGIAVGIFMFIAFLTDFYSGSQWFFVAGSLSELGTILSGTAGVVFALSGVLLFFAALKYQREDLELQRKELRDTRKVLKDQNETVKLQTYEATFFRLIENHIKLVGSLNFSSPFAFEGILKNYTSTKDRITLYKAVATNGEIIPLRSVQHDPIKFVEMFQDSLAQLTRNVCHIIALIKSKLNDDLFYHETFYNTLNNAEKYFIGLYTYCGNAEFLDKLKLDSFNYLEFYEKSKSSFYDIMVDKYVPYINMDYVHHSSLTINHEFFHTYLTNVGFFNFLFRIESNRYKHPIKLVEVELLWQHLDHNETHSLIKDFTGSNISSGTLELFSLFESTIILDFLNNYKQTINRTNVMTYTFTLAFCFFYDGRKIKYYKKFDLNMNNIDINRSLWSLRENNN
jgi:hypothetical protein